MADFEAGFDLKIGQKLLLLLLVAGQFWGVLLATFSLKTGHLPTFVSELARNLSILARKKAENGEKLAICPLSAHFYFQKWPG